MEEMLKKLDILKNSPVREYLRHQAETSIFNEEKVVLREIDSINEANKVNLQNPLKVVILGEVKAGKSTLINSLIGQQVSFTDVSEATTAIIEIKFSEKEQITVITGNEMKDIEYNSFKELNEYIQKTRNQQSVLDNVEKIEVCVNTARLTEITIVDTPGLNTVTKENANRTQNYLAQADVILWVLNCNHLGQSDIATKIEEVMDFGKPIICIANRIDEVSGNSERIKDFIKNEMGYMFKKIFLTSAKLAWEGISEHNNSKTEVSNINALYEYLIKNVERDSKQVQLDSVIKSINTQIARDYQLHMNIKKRLDSMIDDLERETGNLKRASNSIFDMVEKKLMRWAEYEFFAQEKSALLESEDAVIFQTRFNQYCNEGYLNQLLAVKNNELTEMIFDNWRRFSDETVSKLSGSFMSVALTPSTAALQQSAVAGKTAVSNAEVTEGAVRMAIRTGAVGLATAVLPSITIGTALTAICPPLLIGGALIGALTTFVNNRKKKEELNRQIQLVTENCVLEIKTKLNSDILPAMKNNFYSINNQYYNKAESNIAKFLNNYNITIAALKKLQSQVAVYLHSIGDNKNNFSEKAEKISSPEQELPVNRAGTPPELF